MFYLAMTPEGQTYYFVKLENGQTVRVDGLPYYFGAETENGPLPDADHVIDASYLPDPMAALVKFALDTAVTVEAVGGCELDPVESWFDFRDENTSWPDLAMASQVFLKNFMRPEPRNANSR